MNHWKDLYSKHTDRYERLVQYEDVAGNLLPALANICDLSGAQVVEFGVGTGRIFSQIAPLVQQVRAFDLIPAMVRVAQQKRLAGQVGNWKTAVLIETLGTGTTTPNPPEPFIPVYDYFAQKWDFTSTSIRTDYHFSSREMACEIIEPVFGPTMLENLIEDEAGVRLPECTGIWWRSV